MNEREALLYSLCEDDLELSRSYSDTENEGIQGQVSTGAYVKRKFDLGNWFSTATTGHGFQRTRVSEPEKCQFTVPVGSSLSSKRNAALSRAGKQIDSTSTDTDTDEDATTPAKGGIYQEERNAQEEESVASTTDGDKNREGTANDKQTHPKKVLQCTGSLCTLKTSRR